MTPSSRSPSTTPGPGVAKSVTLSDPLPAGGNWSISQAVNAGTCAITGAVGSQTLNCTFGDLAAGATRTLKVKSATSATSCGVYDNTATASSTNNDPASVNDSGKISCRKPSVTVTKTPNDQTIDAGDDAEFTITVDNAGPGRRQERHAEGPAPGGRELVDQPGRQRRAPARSPARSAARRSTARSATSPQARPARSRSRAPPAATSCGVYDNTATASSTNNDPASVNDSGKITCQKPERDGHQDAGQPDDRRRRRTPSSRSPSTTRAPASPRASRSATRSRRRQLVDQPGRQRRHLRHHRRRRQPDPQLHLRRPRRQARPAPSRSRAPPAPPAAASTTTPRPPAPPTTTRPRSTTAARSPARRRA